MRRSRIHFGLFAAAALIAFICVLWFWPSPLSAPAFSPEVASDLTTEFPAPFNEPQTLTNPDVTSWRNATPQLPELDERRLPPRGVDQSRDFDLDDRVFFNDVRLQTNGQQMRIAGEVCTDFFIDQWPPGHVAEPGQLLGLNVEIRLVFHDVTVRYSNRRSVETSLRSSDTPQPVQDQTTSVTVNKDFGLYGATDFALPALSKPLAPGMYELEVALRIDQQAKRQKTALRWCSSLYGYAGSGSFDEDTMEYNSTRTRIFDNRQLHMQAHQHLVEERKTLGDSAKIWVGDLLGDDMFTKLKTRSCIQAKALRAIKKAASLGKEMQILTSYLTQELTRKQRADTLHDLWKLKQRIKQAGGFPNDSEVQLLESFNRQRTKVLQDIARFQDKLVLQYWIILDGNLLYDGWHQANTPGYNIWEAVEYDDQTRGQVARAAKLKGMQAAPGGLRAREVELREAWRYYPDETCQMVFSYLKAKERTTKWDAVHFTLETSNGVKLDVKAWSDFRTEFLSQWLPQINQRLDELDTTNRYAVQVWGDVHQQVRGARDEVVQLPYSYEYYLRADLGGETEADIKASWKPWPRCLTEQQINVIEKAAATAPSNVKLRFDSNVQTAKERINLGDFIRRTRIAIDQNTPPPGR